MNDNDTEPERLSRLDRALTAGEEICSSEGMLHTFPHVLKRPYFTEGMGLVVCLQGGFSFSLNQKPFSARAGETLFVPKESEFQVLQEQEETESVILFYQTDPIRDIIGNSVVSMHLYSLLAPEPCPVWSTGEEEELMRYMSLLDSTLRKEANAFGLYEQKLLLLALTHRICSIHNRKLSAESESPGHKNEIFIRLIQLIEQHYMQERGVEFYADKLCLSPKYLSALSKTICGYTVQQLVFKAIVRKSIALLKNSRMNIQEISDYFNFPNASYFGTFFKKQTGMSPLFYRRQ